MPQGFLVGRLFGTDIYAAPSFLLIVALNAMMDYRSGVPAWHSAVFLLAMTVSVLVHEFGHVFAVKRLLKAKSVVLLWGLGGLCFHEPARRPGQQVVISLMGPAFELALAVAAFGAYRVVDPPPGPLREFLWIMIVLNVIWVAFNLLPILPLDGGQAVAAAAQARWPGRRSALMVRGISTLFAAAATGAAAWLGSPVLVMIGGWLLLTNLMRPR